MGNILIGATVPPVEGKVGRDSGRRTPAASSPASTGDPPPRAPVNVVRSVDNYGQQNDAGQKPTRKIYRQGVRIT
jgi:hypothetical protein